MTATSVSLLRDRLGDVIDTDDVNRFAVSGVVPACVLRPADVDAVVAAVRAARDAGLALVPVGSGTHLDIGHPARRYDAALSSRRLDRILDHEAGDMTVTAQAGVTVAALQYALAAERQWLPLDPPRATDMTLGGLIAADRNGPLRYAYGTVRDWLLGVRVVMADGTCVRGGGRVVKNVAGYDLPKLFAGSYGSLGAIVEATFKVRPLPAAEGLFVWSGARFEDVLRYAQTVVRSAVFPTLLEAINDAAGESLGLDGGPALLVGCAGSIEHVAEQARRVAELSGGAAERIDEEQSAGLRRALADFSQPASEDALVARLSALPTTLASLLPRIEAEATARGIVAEIAAHAGSGVGWCQLFGAADPPGLLEFAGWLRAAAREGGGWAIFESVPDLMRGRLDPWGFDAPACAIMGAVKRSLDPTGVFSPGRFVGGI
jgi:glycolate oxidase FAD binding subunit